MASFSQLYLFLIFYLFFSGVKATTFTFQNRCKNNVWPGIQPSAGKYPLENGGFRLRPGQNISINAPDGWSGRFWGRIGCSFDQTGRGSCLTGDCAGLLACNGAGGEPPISLVEFTLTSPSSPFDYYDISLVDGYNLPVSVSSLGGTRDCKSLECTLNLEETCPTNLQVMYKRRVVACKSACLAYDAPEYCCTEDYGSPSTCQPTDYSRIFKDACPDAYSYAFDDATSISTCRGADYLIKFC